MRQVTRMQCVPQVGAYVSAGGPVVQYTTQNWTKTTTARMAMVMVTASGQHGHVRILLDDARRELQNPTWDPLVINLPEGRNRQATCTLTLSLSSNLQPPALYCSLATWRILGQSAR